MTLMQHLQELRSRLFKSALAITIGFAVGFALRKQIFAFMIQPYCRISPELRADTALTGQDCRLIFTDVLGGFFLSFKAAAVVAIVIAAPIVSYQIWRFVTPGLEPVERRYALPFVIISQLLFLAGAVFAYVVIPKGLEFLLAIAGEDVVALLDASRYMTFMLQTMVTFGLTFEFPLILAMLVLMGVLGSPTLRRYRRHAILGMFVASAIVTPQGDPFTMTVLALPLIGGYEAVILFARIVERRRRRSAAAAAAA